jgi:hypothetical protein
VSGPPVRVESADPADPVNVADPADPAVGAGTARHPAHVLSRALAWLHAHRDGFRLPGDVTEAGVDHNLTLKPLGELAQLSLSIARVSPPGGPVHRSAHELLDFAWRQTRQGELYLELARAEPHTTHLVEMYAPFAQAGLRHREFEDFAGFMARTRGWAAIEQEPTRLLAVLWAEERLGLRRVLDVGGGAVDGPAADGGAGAVRRTWLGGLPEPWAFEGRSGYALTHHVFHVTDWGTRRNGLPPELAEYLAHWLPAWLDSCLDEERWDLAGELLAVRACLPPEPATRARESAGRTQADTDAGDANTATDTTDTTANTADTANTAGTAANTADTADTAAETGAEGADDDVWARYTAAQSPSGAYAEIGPVPDGDERAVFLACYHPTLVAAFASALAVHRATPPPDGRDL